MRKYQAWVYVLLGCCWLGLLAWQAVEHRRVETATRDLQLTHVHDIGNSLAVVIRSQRRFGTVSKDRLVGALEDLAQSRELLGIAMLNPAGEVVAAGGQSIPGDLAALAPGSRQRLDGRLIVASLVELGSDKSARRDSHEPESQGGSTIVWSPPQPSPAAPRDSGSGRSGGPGASSEPGAGPGGGASPPATAGEQVHRMPPFEGPPPPPDNDAERASRRARWDQMRRAFAPLQDPAKYRELYERQGLHMLVLMLDVSPADAALRQDLWLRGLISAVALLAVIGFGLGWRGLTRSTLLQVRLARARAMNAYLRELNLAAAGLAHETRNPLNIVRGLAQVLTKDPATAAAARPHLGTIIEEVDRVTSRLNEFIDYSKPREPKLLPVSPLAIARDAARTLETDFEDKAIVFACTGDETQIMADAGMLRQVFFNLILNATQAVPQGGAITVQASLANGRLRVDVSDNGPGVPESAREDIFRPYFSLNERGSGLGLAVVRQIALAHGWELAYAPRPEGGSVFSILGLEPPEAPAP